jgi:hypothetical protein
MTHAFALATVPYLLSSCMVRLQNLKYAGVLHLNKILPDLFDCLAIVVATKPPYHYSTDLLANHKLVAAIKTKHQG